MLYEKYLLFINYYLAEKTKKERGITTPGKFPSLSVVYETILGMNECVLFLCLATSATKATTV